MSDIPIHSISAVDAATDAALLALNNAHIRETSHLSPEAWRELIGQSFAATCVDGDGALLIVLDHDADYDNANFDWFRARYQRFAYVDRIIVAERLRGQGAAFGAAEEGAEGHRGGRAGTGAVVVALGT